MDLKKGFYFFHADVFFDPLILLELVNTKKDCVLCVEFKKTVEEEMKVRIGNTNILEISKTFPKMFIMYDFYTINESKHHQGTYFVLNGQITDDNFIVEKEGV